jgi:hypothetical protein
MKFLKGFFLVIIVIIMIALIALTQIQFTAQQTLFSYKYFDKVYDDSDMSEAITDFMQLITEDLVPFVAVNTQDAQSLYDEQALQGSAEDLLKGSYAYATGYKSKLPEVEIRPLIDLVINSFMMQFSSDEDMLAMMGTILETYNALDSANQETIKSSLVNELSMTVGLSTEAANDFADDLFEINKSVSDEVSGSERALIVFESAINGLINYDEINDEIDLDEFMDELYSDRDNPAIAVREIVYALKNTLFIMLLVLIFIYIIIIALTTFRAASFFGWLSAPFVGGGLFGLGSGLLGLVVPYAASVTSEASMDVSSKAAEHIISFVDNYSRGITSSLLTQGTVLLLVGIVFIVLAAVFASKSKRNVHMQDGQSPLIALRVILVVVLLLGSFITSALLSSNIADTVVDSVERIENAADSVDSNDVLEALEKTTNLDISFFQNK